MSFNPFRIRILLFLSFLGLKRQIRSYTPVVPSKTIPDFIPNEQSLLTVLRDKRRKKKKKRTLWGARTYMA